MRETSVTDENELVSAPGPTADATCPPARCDERVEVEAADGARGRGTSGGGGGRYRCVEGGVTAGLGAAAHDDCGAERGERFGGGETKARVGACDDDREACTIEVTEQRLCLR